MGGPINVITKNMWHGELDFPGGRLPFPLAVGRTYNSKDTRWGIFGYRWSSRFDIPLSFHGDFIVTFRDGEGDKHSFARLDAGQAVYVGSKPGESLRVEADGSYSLEDRVSGDSMVFSSSGALLEVRNRAGNRQSFQRSAGKVVSVRDEFGHTLSFSYNAQGFVSEISYDTVPVASYSYDAAGNLTRVTYADLSFETYNYEPTGLKRLVSVTDENGNTEASWTYSGGDAIGYARAGGVDAVTISNLGGGKYLVTDAIGNSTTYTSTKYRLGSSPSARSRITEVSGPGCENCPGGVVKATYDRYPARRPQWVKDRNGVVTVFADYDERDLPGRVISDAGGPNEREVSYTYHPAFGRVLEKSEESVLRAGGLKTPIYDYDDDGDGVPNENPTRLVRRLIERGYTRDLAGGVVPYEEITRYDYNSHGQVVAVDGPLGGSADTVTLTYDPASGYLTSRTDPIIGTTTYADHDLYGNPRLVVDPNGNATATEYDARGRMIGSTDVSTGATTQWVRDGKGRLLELRLPAPGRVIYYSYDEADRLTAIADGLGNEIRYSYDLAGNLVRQEVRDPQGVLARYQDFAYNAPQGDGRLSRIVNPDGSYTEYGYDPNGNITSLVDSQGRTVSYSYDSRNLLAGMTEDAGGIAAQTSYEYDQQGNLREVTDAEGRVTAYEYDDGGRLLAVSSADTGTTSYRYDGAGNLMAKSDSSGAMVSYSYDALGRVAGIDYPQDELDVSYTYDEGPNGKGRLTGRVDAGGATAWSFDPLGRVVAVSRETAGVVSTVGYEYDLEGNLVGIGYRSGLELRYSYDDVARVVGVERIVGGKLLR